MWHLFGRGELRTVFWWVNAKERDNLEDLGLDGRIFLKRIFKMSDGEAWAELIWLRMRTGCWLF